MRSPRDLARSLSAVAVAILVVLTLLVAVLAERSYAGWAPERRGQATHARAAGAALSDPPQPPPAPPAPPGGAIELHRADPLLARWGARPLRIAFSSFGPGAARGVPRVG